MFDEVIDSLSFSTQFEAEVADIGDIKHSAIPFSNSNFVQFSNDTKGKIAFIDGGNAEILKSPNFSLQVCRVAYVVFENGKRIDQQRHEFFVLVNVVDGKFVASTFGEDLKFSFDLNDKHFKTGLSQGTPSSVVSAIRRFSELKLASKINADVIVLDGSLQQTYPFEDQFLKELRNKEVVGFCKTSSLLTKSGNSVVALMNLHPGKFAYYPVAFLLDDSYKASICFARLHEKSKYVFKLDFMKEVNHKVLGLLSENSMDPVFLGYPYGLVLADKLARVTNEEADYYRTKFVSKIKNDDLLRYLNALNAHDVLDNI